MRKPWFGKVEWPVQGHTGVERALELRLLLIGLLPTEMKIAGWFLGPKSGVWGDGIRENVLRLN